MPATCSVPTCKSNYTHDDSYRVYSFPSNVDLKRRWITSIRRENFEPSKYSRVCELHFKDEDFISSTKAFDEKTGQVLEAPLKLRRLRPGAVPSQFPNMASYYSTESSSRESPDDKKKKLEHDMLIKAMAKSVEENKKYEASRSFSSIGELCNRMSYIDCQYWTLNRHPAYVIFFNMTAEPQPRINASAVIDENLHIRVYHGDLKISRLKNFSFPCKISNVNDLNDILQNLKEMQKQDIDNIGVIKVSITDALKSLDTYENVNSDTVNFLVEQVSLLGCNKFAYRYSADTLVFASLLYSISPQGYRFLRKSNNLIIPHQNTIHRLCASYDISPQGEQVDAKFLSYIKKKFNILQEKDKLIILMLDEIHLKEYMEYKGGNITGTSWDSTACANSAHVFMIKSVLSKYKDVVHVLPVKKLTGEILHSFIKNVIVGLEEIGFNVLCIITDNNSINRKAVSNFLFPPKLDFVYPHPADKNKPLFYLIDSVHLIKCIRNNWLNQKNHGQCFYYPKFNSEFTSEDRHNFKTASLNSLKILHELEVNSLVKYGYKLSIKALAPSHFEKQNVNLVLRLFNDFVAQGLLELGDKHSIPNYQETADFITLILTWWQIVNVKFFSKGLRLNNVYQTPLSYNVSDDKLIFLHKFLDWLDEWEKMSCTTGMFTRETHTALKFTTDAFIQIVRYCSEELNLDYILPGKFQTDDLESRFGFYRQLAGCQYHISLQQLFECEKKMRIKSLLNLQIPTKTSGVVEIKNFAFDGDFSTFDGNDYSLFCNISVTPSDILDVKPYVPVLIYLAGYCIFSALKPNLCTSCKELHLTNKELNINIAYNFVKNLDRGGLMFPKEHIVNAIIYNYIVIKKLCFDFENKFLKIQNQRNIAKTITISLLDEEEYFHDIVCKNNHSGETIMNKVVWASTNIFLNNYCKKKNDDMALACNVKKQNLAAMKASKRKVNNN